MKFFFESTGNSALTIEILTLEKILLARLHLYLKVGSTCLQKYRALHEITLVFYIFDSSSDL